MAELVVITPSRGRPDLANEMAEAVHGLAAGDVSVWFGLDDDDPIPYVVNAPPSMVRAFRGPRRSLSGWTNHLARLALDSPDPPRYLASLGDDHRPRTKGWDRKLIDAIDQMGGGIAYGNDLLQGRYLCTAWVMSADIVRALGWMMLPVCEHMYVDTAIMEIGRASGRIVYCRDVIIEHLHPLAGKAVWDASYRASNNTARYTADSAAFEEWKANFTSDVDKLTRQLQAMSWA